MQNWPILSYAFLERCVAGDFFKVVDSSERVFFSWVSWEKICDFSPTRPSK